MKESRVKLMLFLLWVLASSPIVLMGWIVGDRFGVGIYGMAIMFEIMILFAIFIYFSSDGLILRWYRANRITKRPDITKTVDEISKKAGISTPVVFVSDMLIPTVFSVGRNKKHASIILTGSLVSLLDEEELGAVLAHEIHHIKCGDILTGTVSAAISGVLTSLITTSMWVSILIGFGKKEDPVPNIIRFLVTSIVAPPAAFIVQLLSSQLREYMADEKSVYIYRKPQKLISALQKIQERIDTHSYDVNPSHVHLFILNPLHEDPFKLLGLNLPGYNLLFKTHPSTDDRTERLNTVSKVIHVGEGAKS